jgi:hypothetical protein
MPWRRASRILFAITIEPGPEIGTEAIHSPLSGFSSGRHHSVIFATLLSKKCSENPNVINCWIANNSHKKAGQFPDPLFVAFSQLNQLQRNPVQPA